MFLVEFGWGIARPALLDKAKTIPVYIAVCELTNILNDGSIFTAQVYEGWGP
jgi:hypothetical protein